MQLPKYHETFIPILEVLSNEKAMHYSEMQQAVRDTYYKDLPPEELGRKTKSGEQLILNRIGWGKAYLKQAGMVFQPKRAMVQITDKGKEVLEKGKLTLADITADPEFLAHRKNKKRDKTSDIHTEENLSPQDMVDEGIESLEGEVKLEILDKLKHVDPYYFERIVLTLFHKMGYGEFFETAKSGDGGIDGIINQDQLGIDKIYVQAKRYSENKVREKDIRNFIGAMAGGTTKGIFVTTSEFDNAAIARVREIPTTIILIDGAKLVDLMYTYGVGVQVKDTYYIKQLDEDFFEG